MGEESLFPRASETVWVGQADHLVNLTAIKQRANTLRYGVQTIHPLSTSRLQGWPHEFSQFSTQGRKQPNRVENDSPEAQSQDLNPSLHVTIKSRQSLSLK